MVGGATYVWRCVICAVTEWALANTGYHDPLVISGGAVRLVVLVFALQILLLVPVFAPKTSEASFDPKIAVENAIK